MFWMLNEVSNKKTTYYGTPRYMAPERVKNENATKKVNFSLFLSFRKF